ncbi:MAG: hypothetical protein CMJ78_09335 [Planctomycetaceae bacterium]|nr:hypothetical protein [Planctomycetaceae bacterium]
MNSVALVVLLAGSNVFAQQASSKIDFGRDILPILSGKCLQCHGPDKNQRQAELRLDIEADAKRDRDGHFAIAAGKPGKSELVARVFSNDPDVQMPPAESKLVLSETEKRLLRDWVAAGATYSKHWAFDAPVKSRTDISTRNPIDVFVHQRLKDKGWQAAQPAELNVLCRRIYLDLIGLPPSPQEIDQFLAATKKDRTAAISGLVDKLMKSPHFGEKWARHWLDVARYADSNGFEKDLPRKQWAWRDWVVRALNADMPYNDFIIQQVAGDMMGDPDALVGSGFLRNGMVNEEGAIVYEQFRIEAVFDRMDCIGKAVLGLSIQCAQCHTHKFDPLTHDEYYGMFAFLNDTYEAQSWVYTPQQREQLQKLKSQIAKLEEQIGGKHPAWQADIEKWIAQEKADAVKWSVLDPHEIEWEGGVNHPQREDDTILILGHPTTSGQFYSISKLEAQTITGVRLEGLQHGDLPNFGPGRNYLGTFTISELEVYRKLPTDKDWQPVELANATADFSSPDQDLPEYFRSSSDKGKEKVRRVGPAKYLIDKKVRTGWMPDRGTLIRHTDSAAVVQLKTPLSVPDGTELKIRLQMNHGGDGDPGDNQQLGSLRLSVTSDNGPKATPFDHRAWLAMQVPADQRTADDKTALLRNWRKTVAALKPINDQIAALEKQFPVAQTSVMHPRATLAKHQRETRLLDRGTWNKPKHVVLPGVPAILHPMEATHTGPVNRLDFAKWLANEKSPLTARVHVNRIWQAIFGVGLVRTSEDFGTRSARPEYLEMLDWLAVNFMESGWSQKHVIRTIINSQTYQQSSRSSGESYNRDPRNQLLARGPRFRVEAEVIRDIALTASGLLNRKMGGPSVFPPVPANVLEYNFGRMHYWKVAEGAERYRRSLYIFRKRSMPDPVLTSFDAPNSDFACARRVRSNTPLAALVPLNEPVFVEAARALSLRVLREAAPNDEARTEYAFRLATSRHPTQYEKTTIQDLLTKLRNRLADGWLSINEVATGDPKTKPNIPEKSTPQDAAAWTLVARVLLNMDETLSKN